MPKYDFMSFGEPNIRLTPPNHDRLGQAEELQLGIAAAELNCCVNISNLSVEKLIPTKKTAYVTKLVDNWTGSYIVKHAQMHGVDMSNVVVEPFDKIALRERGAVEEGILSDRLDGGWQRNVLQRRAVVEGIVADGLDAGRD